MGLVGRLEYQGREDPYDYNRAALAHFKKARAWIEQSADRAEQIEGFRKLRPKDVTTKEQFFEQYVYVVLSSGFRASVAEKKWDDLEGPLKGYDVKAIAVAHEKVRRAALRVFKHAGKVNAIVDTALLLAPLGHDQLRAILTGPVNDLFAFVRQLGFIGPTTRYHLVKNLGRDYPKPDLRLLRLAKEFGFGYSADGVFAMVEALHKATEERRAVIDSILWMYESETN